MKLHEGSRIPEAPKMDPKKDFGGLCGPVHRFFAISMGPELVYYGTHGIFTRVCGFPRIPKWIPNWTSTDSAALSAASQRSAWIPNWGSTEVRNPERARDREISSVEVALLQHLRARVLTAPRRHHPVSRHLPRPPVITDLRSCGARLACSRRGGKIPPPGLEPGSLG